MPERKMGDLDLIHALVLDGVLGLELCPEPNYWHWPVLKPDLLPDQFTQDYLNYGEVRLY